jgi:hypothetical protein
MPFQSEKQRRYLWANEPEIARDWTDTYGSGIAKALGGRIGLYTGGQSYLPGLEPINTMNNPTWNPITNEFEYNMGNRAENLILPGMENMPSGYPWSMQGEGASPNSWMTDKRYVHNPNYYSDATIVDDNRGINTIPFNQQYLEGSGWLDDARTADEMAQLPMDPLRNKRQKLTDFLSRFIPGVRVAKMLRPDANETYGNVPGLYPEEVFGMQAFGSGEDLRTDPWGKNIVSFAGDYEQGKKDWWDKYGKMVYKTPRMKQKKEWHRQAVEKIRQEEVAREQRKRAQVKAMSDQNRRQGVGGWQSAMAKDVGFMTGAGTSDTMGSFNRGGLAALWQR